jgi:hypothetical protein
MIEAGHESQIECGDGNWIFLDVGFSGASGARGKTCGLLMGNADPECLDFAEAEHKIAERVVKSRETLNLVIEAPQSVCFSWAGNPTGRSIEMRMEKRSAFGTSGRVVP